MCLSLPDGREHSPEEFPNGTANRPPERVLLFAQVEIYPNALQ
jgi:hypothetical protein